MMRRVLGALAMALAVGVAAPSWAGGPVTPKLVVLRQVGQEASGGDVALEVGHLLEVVLPENASTGFQWEYAQKINGDVLRVVDSYAEVTSNVPGAPGLQRYLLRGVGPGATDFSLAYRQPWDTTAPPAATFQISVTVKPKTQSWLADQASELGDVNGDGKVNLSDVLLLLRHVLGL